MLSTEQAKERIPWVLSAMRLTRVGVVAENSSGRLADTLVRNLNGEFDEIGMELSSEFRKVEFSEDGEITIHAIEIDD